MTSLSNVPLTIRRSLPEDGLRLVDIWRSSVLATHDFLEPSHLALLDSKVRQFLPGTNVWIAETEHWRQVGFMGLEDGQIESLFVEAEYRGQGVGRALVCFAASQAARLTVEVNEQNLQAVGFYRHLGFRSVGRSASDGQGLPYPILRMQRDR